MLFGINMLNSLLSLRKQYSGYSSFSIFLGFSILYIFLSWVVCGGDKWWVVDYVDSSNVFYGDDAYRFFLARSAWVNPDLYTYNFVLPGFLFLDGTVVSLAGGDIFFSRCLHALMGALSVALIWSSGRHIGINKVIMIAAVLIMGLLPRFALTSLSFYGEAWLAFFLCLLVFFYLHEKFLLVAVLSSMLPLIRPEGMLFWIPIWAFMIMEKKWKEAFIMFFPGLIYFLYLTWSLPSISDYGYWRIELRKILNKLVLNKSSMDWMETYSLLLVFPAFLGWLYRPLRILWPILVGGLVWFGWLMILIIGDFSDYEDRYTYILIPIIILLWAGFFSWLLENLSRLNFSMHWLAAFVAVYASMVVLMHFGNMYMIKGSVKFTGVSDTVKNVVSGRWERIFLYKPQETVEAWKKAASLIENLLAEDEGIDRLTIFDHGFYYYLDPYAIPGYVTVGYATNGYRVFHILFDGQVFSQHPGGEMYSYLDLGEPNFSAGEKRVLYIDKMPLAGYPYMWSFSDYEMYLFSYNRSLKPNKSLDGAPTIDLEHMKKAYDKWW